MRPLRIVPVLALVTTLFGLSVSAPFVDAVAAAPKDKAKPRKAGTTSPSPAPDRRAAGYRVNIEGARLTGVAVSPLTDAVELVGDAKAKQGSVSVRSLPAEVTLTGTGPIPRVVLDQWRAVEEGSPRRANVAIETLDAAGEMIYQHRLYNTLPRKLTATPGKDKWTITLEVGQMELFRAG